MKKKSNKEIEPKIQEKQLDDMLEELVEENKSRIGGIKKIIVDIEKRTKINKH